MSLLEALVPATVRRRIASDPSVAPMSQPLEQRLPAAFLIADISGFTSLAERLSRQGARGAEDLKDQLNLLFGRLIDVVDSWGGEVLKFAGDSTLVYWRADPNEAARASRTAAACALEAQAVVDHLPQGGEALRVRVGVGAGELWLADVGGTDGRWEVVTAGEAVFAAAAASALAGPGEVVVSPAVSAHLVRGAQTVPLAGGFARLTTLAPTPRPEPSPEVTLPPGSDALLREYVPRAVQAWLDAGQSQWLAEFRWARALFVGIDALDYSSPRILDTLQRATTAVQESVYRYGGSLNQLVVDDKGTVFVSGWGLPFHTHDDDAVRAMRAALDIKRRLRALGLHASLGVASDQVFAGLRGNDRRTEYAMIGAAVNLAARLMQAADGDILCDRATFEGAAKRIDFMSLPSLAIKGRVEPVQVFRPVAESATARIVASALFGREAEQRTLASHLHALGRGTGGVVVLEAEAGMGKSRLIADALDRAHAMRLSVRIAAGDAVERSAPYHAFRALYEAVLDPGTAAVSREQRALQLLGSEQRLLPYAALLNPVLRVDLVETEESSRVTPRGRANLTRDLLIRLFAASMNGQQTVLVLEDAHWFDSASWALAEGLLNWMPDLLILIGMRPIADNERPDELRRLSGNDRVRWLRLGALPADAARELARSRLGATTIDDTLARFIFDKAEGHPFFTEELVHVLQDRGAVRIEDGVSSFLAGDGTAFSVALPDTIEGVIASRIDLLTPAEQLTLKVASVLGRTFDLASLRAVHPIESDDVDLAQHLDALRVRDLTLPIAAEGPPTFLFKHVITQDVAYGLLPYAQRRQLHQSVAVWYERYHANTLEPFFALLAHHWGRSEVADKTAYYLEKAGEQAFGRYANQESTRFFREVLELAQHAADRLPQPEAVAVSPRRVVPGRTARRARWERYLGEAYLNIGAFIEGKQHLHVALEALGLAVPNGERAWRRGLFTQLGVQLTRRLSPRPPPRYSAPAALLMREGVRACTRLGGVAYVENRTREILFFLVRALNVAERLPPTIELAVAYADAGNIAALIPLHGLARRYGQLSRRTAHALQDPHTSARVLNRCAIYKGAVGDWSSVADLETAMALAEQVGDPYVWEESAAVRARIGQFRAEFEVSLLLSREQLLRATASGTELHRPWAMQHEGWAALHLGDLDAAFALCAECRRTVAERGRSDPMTILGCDAIEAVGHSYLHNHELARAAADRMLPVIVGSPTIPHLMAHWLSAAAQTFILLWEVEGADASSKTATKARQALRALARYARSNPPAGTMTLLWKGCIEALEGKPNRAHRLLSDAIQDADRRGLPYESARAHFELGRRLGVAEAASREHLLRARGEFERLKAVRDVARVDVVLSALPHGGVGGAQQP